MHLLPYVFHIEGYLNINTSVSFVIVNTLFTVEVHYTQIVTTKQFKGNIAKNPNMQEVNSFLFIHAWPRT